MITLNTVTVIHIIYDSIEIIYKISNSVVKPNIQCTCICDLSTLACLTKHLAGRTGSTFESFRVMFVALLTKSPSAISQTAYSFWNEKELSVKYTVHIFSISLEQVYVQWRNLISCFILWILSILALFNVLQHLSKEWVVVILAFTYKRLN